MKDKKIIEISQLCWTKIRDVVGAESGRFVGKSYSFLAIAEWYREIVVLSQENNLVLCSICDILCCIC